MGAVLERQRQAFIADGPPSAAVRRNRIDRLLALVLDNSDAFVDAMAADFGTRPRAGTLFTEVLGMISVIEHTRAHVPQWMRSTRLMRAAPTVRTAGRGAAVTVGCRRNHRAVELSAQSGGAARVGGVRRRQPRDDQDVGSDAANRRPDGGDRPELLRPDRTGRVTGGADVAAAFSALPFDHLFFTGSPSVGALVQRAAAENLVPVTLELGGKNPVVVSRDADLTRAATRIAQGRMINGGQVCVCPDYVFVPDDRVDAFVGVARATLRGDVPVDRRQRRLLLLGERGQLRQGGRAHRRCARQRCHRRKRRPAR